MGWSYFFKHFFIELKVVIGTTHSLADRLSISDCCLNGAIQDRGRLPEHSAYTFRSSVASKSKNLIHLFVTISVTV